MSSIGSLTVLRLSKFSFHQVSSLALRTDLMNFNTAVLWLLSTFRWLFVCGKYYGWNELVGVHDQSSGTVICWQRMCSLIVQLRVRLHSKTLGKLICHT